MKFPGIGFFIGLSLTLFSLWFGYEVWTVEFTVNAIVVFIILFIPRGGWITRWFDEKRTESQKKIAANLNVVQEQLLNAITRQAKAVHEQRKTAAEFFFYMQKNMGELRALQAKIEIATDTWGKIQNDARRPFRRQLSSDAQPDPAAGGRRQNAAGKELDEWRRPQKIEAARQFNEHANAQLNRMRSELEEAILVFSRAPEANRPRRRNTSGSGDRQTKPDRQFKV